LMIWVQPGANVRVFDIVSVLGFT